MSDELTFLRWVFHNMDRFDSAERSYRKNLLEAYQTETGNSVPGDYKELN